ncbi:MAG: hypothetical protein J5651_00470 [Salinivirgaceae bacterium]|nr:hypothetical protein [Salinivirgaceae bacterium]
MGNIALLILGYLIATLPEDIRDNRLHVHIYRITKRSKKGKGDCVCKIWIEKNGEKDFEVAYNRGIKSQDLNEIILFLDRNYQTVKNEIKKSLSGQKTTLIQDELCVKIRK